MKFNLFGTSICLVDPCAHALLNYIVSAIFLFVYNYSSYTVPMVDLT